MSEPKSTDRRTFLLGALLSGTAMFVGVDDAEARTRRRRRRRPRHKPAPVASGTGAPAATSNVSNGGVGTGKGVNSGSAGSASSGGSSSAGSGSGTSSSGTGSGTGTGSGASGSGSGAGTGVGGWKSDRRLKRAIRRAGRTADGLKLYTFEYGWGGPRYRGVMAQDVLSVRPDAVTLESDGYYSVNYEKLGMRMEVCNPGS